MQTKQKSHATHIWLHYLPCHQKFCFGLNRQSPGWCTTCWLHYLHYHQQFCFGLNRKLHFCQFTYFIYIFESEYVWTCFFYMFHPFAFSHPKGSAEQSTNTFLVARLAHNFLIVLPALSTQVLFWFSQTIALLPIYSFYIFEFEYVWMFCSYVSFICNFPS